MPSTSRSYAGVVKCSLHEPSTDDYSEIHDFVTSYELQKDDSTFKSIWVRLNLSQQVWWRSVPLAYYVWKTRWQRWSCRRRSSVAASHIEVQAQKWWLAARRVQNGYPVETPVAAVWIGCVVRRVFLLIWRASYWLKYSFLKGMKQEWSMTTYLTYNGIFWRKILTWLRITFKILYHELLQSSIVLMNNHCITNTCNVCANQTLYNC